MKTIVTIAAILLISSCVGRSEKLNNGYKTEGVTKGGIQIVTIDNCEYIVWSHFESGNIIHKQNCKNH